MFTFQDEDSPVSADQLDGGGIGAAMTETDGVSTITLTTVDVLFPEYDDSSGLMVATGRMLSALAGDGGSTNIGGSSDALGVNHSAISNNKWKAGYGGSGAEGSDFNTGEAWVIQFDVDVTLDEVELESMAEGNTLAIKVDGQPEVILDFATDGELYMDPLGGLLISAGAHVSFTAGGALATTDYRIESIKVSIPEASMAALVAMVGLATVMRRRLS